MQVKVTLDVNHTLLPEIKKLIDQLSNGDPIGGVKANSGTAKNKKAKDDVDDLLSGDLNDDFDTEEEAAEEDNEFDQPEHDDDFGGAFEGDEDLLPGKSKNKTAPAKKAAPAPAKKEAVKGDPKKGAAMLKKVLQEATARPALKNAILKIFAQYKAKRADQIPANKMEEVALKVKQLLQKK